MIVIEQCRAGRALLGWTQQGLASAAGLSKTAINNFEKGHSEIKAESLRAIQAALEGGGVEFLPSRGLRLRLRSEEADVVSGRGLLTALAEMMGEVEASSGVLCILARARMGGSAELAAALAAIPGRMLREREGEAGDRSAIIGPTSVLLFSVAEGGPALYVRSRAFAQAEAGRFDLVAKSKD